MRNIDNLLKLIKRSKYFDYNELQWPLAKKDYQFVPSDLKIKFDTIKQQNKNAKIGRIGFPMIKIVSNGVYTKSIKHPLFQYNGWYIIDGKNIVKY